MEYDSTSNCDERPDQLESRGSEPPGEKRASFASQLTRSPEHSADSKVAFNVNKSLSKQVMDYYKKYSQSSNLEQYFSLPETTVDDNQEMKYYYSIYELNPRVSSGGRQDCVGQDYVGQDYVGQDLTLVNYVPRERRRWARPPLIGQSANCAESSTIYRRPLGDPRSLSPEQRRGTPETIPEEKNESREALGDTQENKSNVSPTSSVTSHKPLEWDSGADVGYFNTLPQNKQGGKNLSTIERMALARGCSAALRQDPEGTTESNLSSKVRQTQGGTRAKRKPDANSTPLPGNVTETESEVEITPIVKNHMSGIITGATDVSSEKRKQPESGDDFAHQSSETSKSLNTFMVPLIKYATEGKKPGPHFDAQASLLKKSSSMNILAPSTTKLLLKRSQSELNLFAKDKSKTVLPLIFDSTSSLATIVNRPATCDKVIQTTITERSQESIGIQVSVLEDVKPPVPKRGTSLAHKSITSILKSSKNAGRIHSTKKCHESRRIEENSENVEQGDSSYTDSSRNGSRSATPHLDDTENVTGKANSFEYFPGHIYENVPNGSESHASSIDTRRSNSTMPNTSSSIDEKLWGDSDSLVRDLERSVNILKSLVDANKCDKQVKKRLIHHVVKRLVTARYTDDKIEHNLEENVPWNPDDARKKVYRANIIHALTKKQNMTDSSEDWKPLKKKTGPGPKKQLDDKIRMVDVMITLESSNSDKFDLQTDRAEMDGRKARMGLRTDDCQQNSNSPTDANRSESSECFMPQRKDNTKVQRSNIYCYKRNGDTSNSDTPVDQNRMYLNAAINNRQSVIESSNETRNSADWRLPTTLSEKQFELRTQNTSESGDSKLVSYVETEKKNQLLWITNEISHLSNLKKLLEQPKKLERPRMSPKKVKHTIVKQKPSGLLKCPCTSIKPNICDDILRSTSGVCDDSIGPQWSSHCNLATCQSTPESGRKNIDHLKKRNSCTQTRTKAMSAHSQTGGEVTSTVINRHNPQPTLANIHVQTSPSSPMSSTSLLRPRLIQPAANILPQVVCHVHKNSLQVCQCRRQQRPLEMKQILPKAVCLHHPSEQKSSNQDSSNVCYHSSLSLNSNHQRVLASHYDQQNVPNRPNVDIQHPINYGSDKENRKSEPKDAKNKVNATKSMCICDCGVAGRVCQFVGSCSCGINRVDRIISRSDKLTNGICKLCYKKMSRVEIDSVICSCGQTEVGKLCACQDYCTCENANKNNKKLCGCPMGCTCENKKKDTLQAPGGCNACCQKPGKKICKCLDEFQFDNKRRDKEPGDKKTCNCFKDLKCKCNSCFCYPKNEERKPKPKPYYSSNFHEVLQQPSLSPSPSPSPSPLPPSRQSLRSENEVICKCGKLCGCENKFSDTERKLYSLKYNARTNCSCESRASESNENSQQHCPSCGSMYYNERKCSCHVKYPKPIAYELSFTGEKPKETHSDEVAKHNGKIDVKKLPDVPVSISPTHSAKSGGCSCEEIKFYTTSKDSGRTKTLQDYLAQNKPEFLNNVETRQQCMFEISHLRELRREKRIQLLALANGANSTKTTRVSKPKALSAQRKISDGEMKERLRKRYHKLQEVRNKRQQREKQEQARRNKLMANIFCKKLQQKVLKGQVDLSNSVSVISNL